MRSFVCIYRSSISSLLIFVILLQISGCSSNYFKTYSGDNLLIVDAKPDTDSVSVVYTADQKIAFDDYYWKKNKIYFIDSTSSQQKQSLKIYDIDSVTFSDQRTMVLVSNNMYIMDSLFLKNGQIIEPLDFEWTGQQLAFRTLQTYPLRTIVTLFDIQKFSAVYRDPGRFFRPGMVLLYLGIGMFILWGFYLPPYHFARIFD